MRSALPPFQRGAEAGDIFGGGAFVFAKHEDAILLKGDGSRCFRHAFSGFTAPSPCDIFAAGGCYGSAACSYRDIHAAGVIGLRAEQSSRSRRFQRVAVRFWRADAAMRAAAGYMLSRLPPPVVAVRSFKIQHAAPPATCSDPSMRGAERVTAPQPLPLTAMPAAAMLRHTLPAAPDTRDRPPRLPLYASAMLSFFESSAVFVEPPCSRIVVFHIDAASLQYGASAAATLVGAFRQRQ